MPYNSVADNFHRNNFFERYERKQIENRRFRSNAVTLTQNFRQKGTSPTNNFCMDSQANECPTTLLLTVFTQRNFVADFLQKIHYVLSNEPKIIIVCCPQAPKGGSKHKTAVFAIKCGKKIFFVMAYRHLLQVLLPQAVLLAVFIPANDVIVQNLFEMCFCCAGEQEIPGLTDTTIPRRLGPKRASKIRKLFNLRKEDDVRQYVVRRPLAAKEGSLPTAVFF